MEASNKLDRYRWIVLLIVWLGFLISGMDRFAWSSISAPVGRELRLPVMLLGTFTTAFYIGYSVSCCVGGFLSDVFGSRKTLTVSLFALGLLTMGFSHVEGLRSGVAIQAAMGFAAGAEYGASVKILANWFLHEKGRAFGIWLTGTSLAVTFTNLAVPAIVVNYHWQIAYQLLGAGTLLMAAASLFFLRNTPASVPAPRATRAQFRSLMRNPNLLLIALAGAAGFFGTIGFIAWATALMTVGRGIEPIQAGFVTVLFGIGAVAGKPLAGWLYDRVERHARTATVMVMLAFAALLVVFAQCSTLTALRIVAPVLGVFAYAYNPIMVGLYTRAVGPALTGAAAGVVNTAWSLGSSAGPAAVGYVYGTTHSLQYTLLVTAMGPVLAAVFIMFVRDEYNYGVRAASRYSD
jgi:sugar phosphate permease